MNVRRWLGAGLVLAGAGIAAALDDPVRSGSPLAIAATLATAGWLLAMPRSGSPMVRASRSDIALVFAVSAAARLLLLLPDVPPSDDLYRYLWDGRTGAAGINPFVHPPDADALTSLRDDVVWPNVNHPEVSTIYPPTAQLYFRVLEATGGSPRAPRAGALLGDLVTVGLLVALLRRRGESPAWALAFGWCPLAMWESAAGGHVDALGVTLLAAALLALHRTGAPAAALGGVLVGLSALAKPVAPFVVPALLFARPGRERIVLLAGGAAAMLLWIPYLDAGERLFTGFLTYARHWHFNDAVYSHLVRLGGEPAALRTALAALSVALAFGIGFLGRRRPLAAGALAVAAALFLSPTVHPWYVVWVAMLLPFAGRWFKALAALVALVPMAYVAAWSERTGGGWSLPGWIPIVVWGVPLLLFAAAAASAGRDREAPDA